MVDVRLAAFLANTWKDYLLKEHIIRKNKFYPTVLAFAMKQQEDLEKTLQSSKQIMQLSDFAVKDSEQVQTLERQSDNKNWLQEEYTLAYFNPYLGVQSFKETQFVLFSSFAQKAIEDACASRSSYPIYNYISAPLLKAEIQKKQIELAHRIIPPDNAPSAQGQIAETKNIAHEIELQAKEEAIRRKRRIEEEIKNRIVVVADVLKDVKKTQKKQNLNNIIKKLPPLTYARLTAWLHITKQLQPRKTEKTIIIDFLKREQTFARGIKRSVHNLTPKKMAEIVEMLNNLNQDSTEKKKNVGN